MEAIHTTDQIEGLVNSAASGDRHAARRLFSAIGQANATLLISLFPLTGLLAAIFILPEIYGFEHD